VDIFALDELLQAGKDLLPNGENDGEGALFTGFMKQFVVRGSLSYF
jgi:hypothetical protein